MAVQLLVQYCSQHVRARGLISIPTPPIVALTEFFHVDAVTNFHPLSVS